MPEHPTCERQLRIYHVTPGMMEEFVDTWREHVVPLRRQFGLEVAAAWVAEQASVFAWIVEAPDLQERDRRYYDSAKRRAVPVDFSRFITATQTYLVAPTDWA